VKWVVFVAEVLALAFLSFMLLLLFALLAQQGPRGWNFLLPVAGVVGLGSLWWLLLTCGRPAVPPRRHIPLLIRIGLVVGVGLSLYLFIQLVREGNPALAAQGLLWFGAPIAVLVHLLVRQRIEVAKKNQ
jgi:hypothetical protein